jgi:hypothetical protein
MGNINELKQKDNGFRERKRPPKTMADSRLVPFDQLLYIP